MKSTGMDWKALEEKPDNWEMMQNLIGSATDIAKDILIGGKNVHKKKDQKDIMRETGFLFPLPTVSRFIVERWQSTYRHPDYPQTVVNGITHHSILQRVKDLQKTPPATSGPAGSNQKNNPGKKKGTTLNKADQIRLKNSERLLEKDLENIHFDIVYHSHSPSDTGNRKIPKSIVPTRIEFKYEVTLILTLLEWWMLMSCLPSEENDKAWVECLVASERLLQQMQDANDPIWNSTSTSTVYPLRELVETIFQQLSLQHVTEKRLHSLFENPKLMMFSIAEKRKGSVKLYSQQIDTIQEVVSAIIQDTPLLLGNRQPPGTGKTFNVIPMAQAIQAVGRQKTLIFCCPNPLVNKFVASTTLLGHDLHLWQAKCLGFDENNERIFIVRPHKRCFPASWKKTYKDTSSEKYGNVMDQYMFYTDKARTGRVPDVLVCDPITCLEFLSQPQSHEKFVAVVDEVIGSPETTGIMTKILKVLPEHAVVMSAILPRFEDTPFFVDHFKERYTSEREGRRPIIKMIDATGVTIPCTVVDPEGHLSVPHHFVKTIDDIPVLMRSLEEDPLIRRMYSPIDIFRMITALETNDSEPSMVWVTRDNIKDWKHHLPTLGGITYPLVLRWWCLVLQRIYENRDTKNWDLLQKYRPKELVEKPVFEDMFSTQAYIYKSKHLHVLHNKEIYRSFDGMIQKHLEGAPDVEEMRRNRDQKMKQLELRAEKMDNKKNDNKPESKLEKMKEFAEMKEEYDASKDLPWPKSYVVNSKAHFERFHPGIQVGSIGSNNEDRQVCVLPREHEDSFSTDISGMMMAGVIMYEENIMTEYQRRLVLQILSKMNFIVSGEEIVFGTNIDGLTGLSIDHEFSEPANRSVLFQLIGRIGRVGMSYSARVIVDSNEALAKIMKTPVYDPESNPDPDVLAMQRAWV